MLAIVDVVVVVVVLAVVVGGVVVVVVDVICLCSAIFLICLKGNVKYKSQDENRNYGEFQN